MVLPLIYNLLPMSVALRSYAKINFGLRIGPLRPDGFHGLFTIYRTIALHDRIRVELVEGTGIEIRCANPDVPTGEGNTCWRVAERVAASLNLRQRVIIEIEKHLPLQGGMGAASSNAIACLFAIEQLAGRTLPPASRQEIAASVGSDLPLFLLGGTTLGTGRGELIQPLPDLPPWDLVVVTPQTGVSTPAAFAAWDRLQSSPGKDLPQVKLTPNPASGRISEFNHAIDRWLGGIASGVLARGGDRVEGSAESAQPLLDFVRTGIENDFEQVVFPEYPELSEVKRLLYQEGAFYASLSGSGSTLYGVFPSAPESLAAATVLNRRGFKAAVSRTVGREEYGRNFTTG
jgi:4-diphosphocytidyl-2-C-methyl-D-erythritol kinase